MSKFKVGDRVESEFSNDEHEFGVATVTKIDRGWVSVRYDDYSYSTLTDYHTEHSEFYTLYEEPTQSSKPDGGPAGYYDLPEDRPMNTLNDILEWKGETQWLGDSFHLANVTKAGWRWGIKDGTTKEYDARKFIYSGARLLMKYAGVKELRKTLQKMLDDPQFKE